MRNDFVIENGVLVKYVGPGGDVVIPEGVTSIGEHAFENCRSLTSIMIPDGVTSIERYAFYQCENLTELKIPDSVTSIGGNAFMYCCQMTSISIPESVAEIGNCALRGCPRLADPDGFVVVNGSLYDYLGNEAKNISIPNSVVTITEGVFEWHEELTSITIPDSVIAIGSHAFSHCEKLKSIMIPASVKTFGNGVFSGCSSLQSIVFPESLSCIPESTFMECANLKEITIPDSVTTIGHSAFFMCKKLSGLSIPDSVTTIERNAFSGCVGLADQTGMTIIRDCVYACRNDVTEAVIPETVSIIGYMAFANCKKLSNVTIPDSVTTIDEGAFQNCVSLTSIKIPDSVTTIDWEVFSGCSSLKSITIPDSVTYLGREAFRKCNSLESITIPEQVKSIGSQIFANCPKLYRVNTGVKLTADQFGGKREKRPIITNDPDMLPSSLKPYAAVGYAEIHDDSDSNRAKKHLKYIKSNAAKLIELAFEHSALLHLLCEQKLLTPEVTQAYLDHAQMTHNTEATAMLLDYQQNGLTDQEKEKSAAKAEAREEKITDFVFSAAAIEQLTGKTFVVTGKLTTMTRAEFKACLDACGAKLSETLNAETAYLITNTPDSGSAKNKKAEQLGVKKLTEAEFNKMIGRE